MRVKTAFLCMSLLCTLEIPALAQSQASSYAQTFSNNYASTYAESIFNDLPEPWPYTGFGYMTPAGYFTDFDTGMNSYTEGFDNGAGAVNLQRYNRNVNRARRSRYLGANHPLVESSDPVTLYDQSGRPAGVVY